MRHPRAANLSWTAVAEPLVSKPVMAATHLLDEVTLEQPFWRYREMFADCPHSFLLDSALESAGLGQFSYVGGDPLLVFRAKRTAADHQVAEIELTHFRSLDGEVISPPRVERRMAAPLDELRILLERYAVSPDSYQTARVSSSDAKHGASSQQTIIAPLLSGAVGYFGYECGQFFERLPAGHSSELQFPDMLWMFCDALLVHCHATGKSYLSVLGRGETEHESQARAATLREQLLERIARFEKRESIVKAPSETQRSTLAKSKIGDAQCADYTANSGPQVAAHFDRASYSLAVEQIQTEIRSGNAFEVCLTQRLSSPLVGGSAWELYGVLRQTNPAPFAAYLDVPEGQIVCCSPERFLRLSPNRIAESRPIKGTRRAGATDADNNRIAAELAASAKDRAENIMIVDLVRNDLGRVCQFYSIHVPQLLTIERYATVLQMVSTVRGTLRDDAHPLDLVRSCFPPGSMTGAPKIEAMKIIDKLEPIERGVYSGAIGYLDYAGTLDLNVVIRTLLVERDQCYYNAGGAVVADSVPEREYEESLDKVRALQRGLTLLALKGESPQSFNSAGAFPIIPPSR